VRVEKVSERRAVARKTYVLEISGSNSEFILVGSNTTASDVITVGRGGSLYKRERIDFPQDPHGSKGLDQTKDSAIQRGAAGKGKSENRAQRDP